METAAVNILLVDASGAFPDVAGLDDSDCRFVRVSSLAEALAATLDGDVALVIADVTDAGVAGYELARRSTVPVILRSADPVAPADVHRAYAAGAVDFLQGPVDRHVLLAKISVFARLHRQMLQLRHAGHERQRSRLAAEELLAILDSLVDTAPIGFAFVTPDLRFRRINAYLAALYDTTPEAAIGRHAHDIDPKAADRFETLCAEVLRFGRPIEREEVTGALNGRADGRRYWIVTYYPIVADGETLGVGILALDATETKRAAAAIEAARAETERLYEQAQHAGRLKDEFLATLSHELRTPLNIILGYTELLQDELPEPETLTHALRAIYRNARAQADLIGDLLDISRIVSGKLQLTVTSLDLGEVVRAAVESVALSATARDIHLEVAHGTDLNAVSGDAARLQQVVWNLLSNAIKFTPPGGRVTVELAREHDQVDLVVRDTGEGIDREFLPYVFDRFRQENSSKTRRHGGLGLGLSIVRYLVELHGGWVHAESAGKGHGSAFHIVLPAAAGSVSGSAPPAASEETSPTASGALAGLRVLLVDDQPDVRALGSALLRKAGAEVAVAGGVREALAVFREFRPNVLLSDIGMPEESGYDLIREIRQLPAEAGGNIPAAALTAYARPEERQEAENAGFQLHLPKPVRVRELIAAVQRLAQQA